MIVIGIDPHKRSHTAVALERATGAQVAHLTVPSSPEGSSRLLAWGLSLAPERVFCLEDCRHVSGPLERFLLARCERVVRVPPKLMAGSRRSARERGKSDAIDATSVARAYLREPSLALAHVDPVARELKLLGDHRDSRVRERTRQQNQLRWHLHELELGDDLPAGALDRLCWQRRIAERLASSEQTTQVLISSELVSSIALLTRRVKELEREIEGKLRQTAPALIALPGCRALTAAKIVAEVGGVGRLRSEAALALHAGVAPLDASSGEQRRHRLNRSGNRQLNLALHRIAVNQGRCHPPARAYLERRQAEGKTRREALRCLKRHLARTVYRLLRDAEERSATLEPAPLEPVLT